MALRGWTRWLPSSLLALHSSSCVGTNGMALCALWRQWPWNILAASGVAQALGGSMILPDVTTDLNKRKMRTSQRNWCLTASLRVCPVRARAVWGRQGRSPLARIHRQCLLQPLWSLPRYVPTCLQNHSAGWERRELKLLGKETGWCRSEGPTEM